jgi:hypothetical protein
MGCFSFICKFCGHPVRSDSFRGERVHLFLLKDGKVIESMAGEYDSYGRVFDDNGQSIEWKMDWSDVCELMFSSNKGDGIAAIHADCLGEMVPTTRSENDPDQGWGRFQTADGQWFCLDYEDFQDDD